jgi:hypothetical protein
LGKLSGIPPFFAGSFSVTNDRNGNMYYTPLVGSIGTPGNAANMMLNYMVYPTNEAGLKSYLTGISYNITGGYVVGMSITANQHFNQWSVGVGLTTKGVAVSTANQPEFFT